MSKELNKLHLQKIFLEVKPYIQSALDGENVCVFAYGSTGSGKTFTMQGGDENNKIKNNNLQINKSSGLLPRSAEFIFEEITRLENLKYNYNLFFSAVEIYNDNVYDLLYNFYNPTNIPNSFDNAKNKKLNNQHNQLYYSNSSNPPLINNQKKTNSHNGGPNNLNKKNNNYTLNNDKEKIVGNYEKSNSNLLEIYFSNNECVIKNLIWMQVKNKEDILSLAKKASDNRRSDSTQFNSCSSRSHAIFQIKIEFTTVRINENQLTNNKPLCFSSVLNIVDLAGSEKNSLDNTNKKNKEEIEYAKKIQNEANFINKSLTTLGRIITLINDKKNSKIGIPYRESKLTMLLSNSLKPDSKTVLIVTVCSDDNNYNMSKESLKFAANAMVSV